MPSVQAWERKAPVKALLPSARVCSGDFEAGDGTVPVRLFTFKKRASRLLPAGTLQEGWAFTGCRCNLHKHYVAG